jgi:hypothetical protein
VANTHSGEGDHFGLAAVAVGTSARVWKWHLQTPRAFNTRRQQGERAELIAALHQVITFAEGLLRQTELLLSAFEADTRPTPRELAEVRANVERWREQVDILRQRLVSLTVEPTSRPQ